MASIILSLSRNMNRIVWFNIIFLGLVALFIFHILANLEPRKSIVIASLGVLLGAGNHLYMNIFKLRRVSRELISSFETMQRELRLDDLTGVYNRRSGLKRLEEEMALAQHSGGGVSVALIDIDNFEKVNKTYGHLAGDEALKEIGGMIRQELRQRDVAVRYGGEEFLVIMPDTDEKGALYPLDRLRRRIAHTEIDCHGDKIKISIRMALTSMQADEDAARLLNRADQALVRSKLSRRNGPTSGRTSPGFEPKSFN